jgi:hypothetical protein
VLNPQDLNSVGFHRVDNDPGEWHEKKLTSALYRSNTTHLRQSLQSLYFAVDEPQRRFPVAWQLFLKINTQFL